MPPSCHQITPVTDVDRLIELHYSCSSVLQTVIWVVCYTRTKFCFSASARLLLEYTTVFTRGIVNDKALNCVCGPSLVGTISVVPRLILQASKSSHYSSDITSNRMLRTIMHVSHHHRPFAFAEWRLNTRTSNIPLLITELTHISRRTLSACNVVPSTLSVSHTALHPLILC